MTPFTWWAVGVWCGMVFACALLLWLNRKDGSDDPAQDIR